MSEQARTPASWWWMALCVLAWVLGGCASPRQAPSVEGLLRDAAYAPPATPLPRAEELFALSPAMRRFLLAEFASGVGPRDTRLRLIDALYRSPEAGGRGLRLMYEASHTRTAAEAFEAQAGNCLSLVMMTAAFSRQLEVAVSFQAVRTDQHYSRVGSLTLASGHVNLVLGAPPARHAAARFNQADDLIVDFLSPPELLGQRSEPLAEQTIVAMYFNNRAAELLAAGQADLAYWHAREALRHDPGFVHAANTLGVIHQRAGQPVAAEAAFRHVLAHDPHPVAALGNLVALLTGLGRVEEARAHEARLLALQPVPPFQWLRQGREALAAGDTPRALELFKRELRRQPEQDEVHFALAEAHLRLGNLVRAQHHLAQAAEFSTRRSDQTRYEDKLSQLRATMRGRPNSPS
jgi:Tfp pilus assembly protein PilF